MISPRHAGIGLFLLALAGGAFVLLMPPLAQPLSYHGFADDRAALGVPNFLNTVSNLAFLLVAVLGVRALLRPDSPAPASAAELLPYWVLFLALAATGFGSAYYHWAPDNARLFWDRLPMSIGFAGFVSIVAVECLGRKSGLRLLAPLLAVGVATVLWWRLSAAGGSENVLPYFAFQAWSIMATLLLLGFLPPRHGRGAYLLATVVLYGAAMAAEWFDPAIFALGQVLGGHALKHLLAALALYQVVRLLRRRQAV